MDRILLLVLLTFQLGRLIILYIGHKEVKFLWVSFFLISVPLEIERALTNDKYQGMTGTLTPIYQLSVPVIICCILLLFKSKASDVLAFKFNNWATLTLLILLISLVNPYNENFTASGAFILFFISHILLFKIFSSSMDYNQIVKGFFDGFFILCACQFILAICFPLLGIISVTNLFHVGGQEAATRFGSRDGAIGFFIHPGPLALFTMIASSFFVATFSYNYNKKLSLLMLILNGITIILTYSRTSYIAFVLVIAFLFFIRKNYNKNIFSIANLFKFILPSVLFLGWLIFLSPLKSAFLESDVGNQVGNRVIHYLMAYEMFKSSPFIGVGINAHLTYVATHPAILSSITKTNETIDFYRNNPIHNSHLTILAETGLIGFISWVIFILRNIVVSKNQIAKHYNPILSLTFIGTLVTIIVYGLTGWAALANGILPFFLIIAFFAIKYRTAK